MTQFSRRSFIRGLFFTGATAVVAPTKLVQVAVGFDAKPDGTIETAYDRRLREIMEMGTPSELNALLFDVLHRYNEAIALDYVIPFRLITPAPRAGAHADHVHVLLAQ